MFRLDRITDRFGERGFPRQLSELAHEPGVQRIHQRTARA
jgi:hypothetical protein